MSDLSITASAVQPGAGSTVIHGTAGEAIAAGQAVYKDANAATAAAEGIAANSAADEQPLAIVKRGPLVTGATTVKGTVYVLSDNAGGICPAADLSSGSYTTILAVAADNAGTLNIHIHASGVQW